MDDQDFQVYSRILRVAMAGDTISYSVLAEEVGLPTTWPQLGPTIGPILDRINDYERFHGRPLGSAVVVLEGQGIPGPGFFDMAERVGAMIPGEDQFSFWAREIAKVRRAWA
jgi:hypothetical protein